ncbi:hypothetical protein [Pontiella sulfatireligans]|uniref:Uncharacterized protein n=1 Tax=Pontiella sulfatireligans TaxID=2750658 RepID=A0A6C2UM61_9BACT|nr:hypothetical protein [Pontiella sulfatireligans]VGO21362.1 hypothetical protein SCARR_03434 [Pontiella sulfatireligans]
MGRWAKGAARLAAAMLVAGGCVYAQDGGAGSERVLTHADAAVVLARYSGLFDRYLGKDASLSECVSFLNKHGIYFGLLEVVNGSEFTVEDCARAMGQIELVFSGEAEYAHGKVNLSKNVESWEEFCILNDVKYVEAYESMRVLVRSAMVKLSE